MSRDTIKSLAKEIAARWPEFRVTVERGYCNTDRKIGRLRHAGKGRWGTQVIVRDAFGKVILNHNNAETYRCTAEVRRWMEQVADGDRCFNGNHRAKNGRCVVDGGLK